MDTHSCDVLIIGGGGAALRGALAAHDAGASVVMAIKGKAGGGATGYRVSEMAAFNVPDGVVDPDDSPEAYYNDIMNAAHGMADPATVRVVAEGAVGALRQLTGWGVKFEMENGRFYAYSACFSTRKRSHVIKGHGDPIIAAQLPQIRRRGIAVHEHTSILSLVTRDGVVAGAVGLDGRGGPVFYSAKAVVMATGGASQMFRRNMNPADVTGDGCVMAYRAGARLVNLEFMQAGLGFCHPAVSLINAYVWGGHPILTNSRGEEFLRGLPGGLTPEAVMDEHRKHFPFSSADISRHLEVGIQRELAEGRGTANGGVHADFTMMTDEYVRGLSDDYGIRHMWPLAKNYYYEKGVRLLERKVEVACFAHAWNGGIKINERAESSLPGLYAAGETAGGPHGADRLGGNMMVTCQVFGKVAGENAAAFAASGQAAPGGEAEAGAAWEEVEPLLRKRLDIPGVRSRLRDATQRDLLVRRTAPGLQRLLGELAAMEEDIASAPGGGGIARENAEVENLVQLAALTAGVALERAESRGSHYREDFPNVDPKFGAPRILEKAKA